MNLFYYTIGNDDNSLYFECFGWKKCIIPYHNKYIVDNIAINKRYQFLRLQIIINSIIITDINIKNILIIGDGYGSPYNNQEYWKYSINENNKLILNYMYNIDYRNEYSKLFTQYNVINIATPCAGFINETSIIRQLFFIYNQILIDNLYYDAIILIKCSIFNKFIDQDVNKLLDLTNIAEKCLY